MERRFGSFDNEGVAKRQSCHRVPRVCLQFHPNRMFGSVMAGREACRLLALDDRLSSACTEPSECHDKNFKEMCGCNAYQSRS